MADYIDASALVAVILKEPANAIVDPLFRDRAEPVLVSDLCLAECSSAIATMARRSNLDARQVGALWRELDDWVALFGERISIESADISASIGIVRQFEHKLRAPDAIHISAARRLDAQLITLDRRMAEAARALAIEVINPAEISAT